MESKGTKTIVVGIRMSHQEIIEFKQEAKKRHTTLSDILRERYFADSKDMRNNRDLRSFIEKKKNGRPLTIEEKEFLLSWISEKLLDIEF